MNVKTVRSRNVRIRIIDDEACKAFSNDTRIRPDDAFMFFVILRFRRRKEPSCPRWAEKVGLNLSARLICRCIIYAKYLFRFGYINYLKLKLLDHDAHTSRAMAGSRCHCRQRTVLETVYKSTWVEDLHAIIHWVIFSIHPTRSRQALLCHRPSGKRPDNGTHRTIQSARRTSQNREMA